MRLLAVFAPKHRRPEVRKEIDCDNDRHCILPNFPSIRPFLQPPDQRREKFPPGVDVDWEASRRVASSIRWPPAVTPHGSSIWGGQSIPTESTTNGFPPCYCRPAVQFQHTGCIKGRRKDEDVSLPVLLLAWIQLGRPLFLMLPLLELAPRNCASLSTHIGLSACVPKG